MDLNLTWGDLAEACRGRLSRGEPFHLAHAICTDSRGIEAGQIFWALRGERFDARRFLDERLARLCDGWVIQQGASLPKSLAPHIIEVEDTRLALADLAFRHRRRFDIPTVAITGSNGKTTVKEMLRFILSRLGPVCCNAGNFNNEIGLPLSVLELSPHHRFAIFEMGASHPGDIRALTRIAQPTVGVLTNIGPAHIEFFGDLENVYHAKTELVHGLSGQTPVVLNVDDPYLMRLVPALRQRAVTFGTQPQARVRALACAPGSIELDIAGNRIAVRGEGFGQIHRINAAAAAAAAFVLGVSTQTIQQGLTNFQPAPLRFQPRQHASGAWFVIDAYNANPASMRAGIETFLETAPLFEPAASNSAKHNAKKVARPMQCVTVLGDMKELGKDSLRWHRELGQWLANQDLAAAYFIGEDMAEAASGLKTAHAPFPVYHAPSPDSLLMELRRWLKKGVALYFKASRAMRLENLVEKL